MKWVSALKKLPEKDVYVLIHFRAAYYVALLNEAGYFITLPFSFVEIPTWLGEENRKAELHWRYLPNPPENKDELKDEMHSVNCETYLDVKCNNQICVCDINCFTTKYKCIKNCITKN